MRRRSETAALTVAGVDEAEVAQALPEGGALLAKRLDRASTAQGRHAVVANELDKATYYTDDDRSAHEPTGPSG